MSVESGRRPVLATLSASQVPLLGQGSALRGLTAGMQNALYLAEHHTEKDVLQFDLALHIIRSSDLYDISFGRAFASGYTLAAAELRRIGGVQ